MLISVSGSFAYAPRGVYPIAERWPSSSLPETYKRRVKPSFGDLSLRRVPRVRDGRPVQQAGLQVPCDVQRCEEVGLEEP